MHQPLSVRVLIIPALSAAAAAALVVLALMPEPAGPKGSPEAAAADGDPVAIGKPARLDAATPVPAPRPGRSSRR